MSYWGGLVKPEMANRKKHGKMGINEMISEAGWDF
jgi:hypothetical protein